ncbi:MAG TPA: TIGR00341 family protein [Flavobacterium lutivivi]|nr:TIGR00341 family protein [Flavobacterium lutivivi]
MLKSLFQFTDLHNGEEKTNVVLENVTSNISFRGSNIWILACAIVVASVGLNVNSTAVIIGAMLISPLMGPIVGAGFGLGIFDFNLLKRSLKNLFIATLVSLIVSSIYFFISPFKETQSELLSRTSPTIYDVLIAFFGGLVGAIAITRKEKGNPIPGVAIATALMPPLCTAGYGIAIGNIKFFFGALFLYSINCVFICIATFVIVKYLKYPALQYVDKKREKKIKNIIYGLVFIMILPSTYFAYQLIQEKKYIEKANQFIDEKFNSKGYYILKSNINSKSNPKKIEIALLSKKFTKSEIKNLNNELKDYNINNTELIIRQDTTNIKKSILDEINIGKSQLDKKDLKIAELQKYIQDNTYDNNEIYNELTILFPEIKSISIANHIFYQKNGDNEIIPVMVYESSDELDLKSKEKIRNWLVKRLNKTNFEIIRKN